MFGVELLVTSMRIFFLSCQNDSIERLIDRYKGECLQNYTKIGQSLHRFLRQGKKQRSQTRESSYIHTLNVGNMYRNIGLYMLVWIGVKNTANGCMCLFQCSTDGICFLFTRNAIDSSQKKLPFSFAFLAIAIARGEVLECRSLSTTRKAKSCFIIPQQQQQQQCHGTASQQKIPYSNLQEADKLYGE